MPRLTKEQLSVAEKASEDLYRYEKAIEEHSAVLRKDPDCSAKAHAEYSAKSNGLKMGFMPAPEDFDHYLNESEKALTKECISLLDHLHVVCAGFFLSRLLMRKMSEHGEKVYLEFIRQKVALDKKYPYIFPKSPPSVEIASNPSPPVYPLVLPAQAFTSDDVMGLRRVCVNETDLLRYQEHPEQLQKETFASFNVEEDEWEIFRVSAFLTLKNNKLYYLVSADGGTEAMAWSSNDFFDLLRTSQHLLI